MGSYRAVTVAAADTPDVYLDGETADFTCNGSRDEQQIQSAIHAAIIRAGQTTVNIRRTDESVPVTTTNTGAVVHLLPGSYILGADIHLGFNRHQITLRGSGPSTVIKQATGDHAITAIYDRAAEGDSLQIEDLRIEGVSGGYHGIFTANCHRMRFHNLQIFNVGLDGIATIANDIPIYEDDSDLITPWSWVAGSAGTGEYYLVYFQSLNSGKGIDWRAGKPNDVDLDGGNASEGTVGSLAAGEWGWGDNDSIGYNTVYVRLSDDSKPDPGDVELNNYSPASNNHVSDCAFQWAGRMGNRWIGNHETLITNCHYEGNAHGGLYHERTFNFKISNCSIEDTLNSKPGYKSVEVNDSIVTGTVCEDNAEISAADASFEQFAGCSITGTCDITSPFTVGNNLGAYSFASTRINGIFSTSTAARRIEMSACPSITLGDITAEYFQAGETFIITSGDDKTLTIAEAASGNDSGAYFSGCHFRGTGGSKIYTFQASGNDNQSFTFCGGKMHDWDMVVDGNAVSSVSCNISGVRTRFAGPTIDDMAYVNVSGCTITGTGDWTISNIDNDVVLSGNIIDSPTITVSGTGDCIATGNSGNGTITSNVSGTEAQSNNGNVTVSSFA